MLVKTIVAHFLPCFAPEDVGAAEFFALRVQPLNAFKVFAAFNMCY
jgi:hypothetical protein